MSNGTSYQVLARKYRPQTFSELTGQEHVSRTLQNAIDTGRVAHAFLFTGARGVGKTSTARILARALNCEQGVSTEPCNVCHLCVEIKDGTSTDVFEIDGASNTGVDDIRELRDNVRYLPSHSRYKIFIIDEVHMLSNNAFNALLKTLEEPPAHVKFIFATTEPHKLPVTILSRCQRFDFKRVSVPKIMARLRDIAASESVTISDTALALISRKGDGSMRDSLTAFDQVLAFCGNSVSDEDVVTMIGAVDRRLLLDISTAVFAGDTQGVLACVKKVDEVGYNMRQFCQELIDHFRNLLVSRAVKSPADILDLSDAELEELRQQSVGRSLQDIQRRLTLLIKAENEMAFASFQRLILEMALIKSALLVPVIPINELMEQLKTLEVGAVHSPAPMWNPGSKPDTDARDHGKAQHAPTAVAAHDMPLPATAPIARGNHQLNNHADWEKFIRFVIEQRPAIGSVLEHGSALKLESGVIEIGFPAGSYYLTSAQDADSIKEIQTLAHEYSGQERVLRVRSISPETGESHLSLVEKKKIEQEQRREKLKQDITGHPVVNEALRVFGGTITDIREI